MNKKRGRIFISKLTKALIIMILMLLITLSVGKYIIPKNFLDDISQNQVYSIYVFEYIPNKIATVGKERKYKTSYDEKINSDILTYLKNLDTIRVKKSTGDINIDDINFEYNISIKNTATSFTICCYLDDLSTIGIHSNDNSVPPGVYKIVNGDFDYQYINELIYKQNQ